MGGEGEEEEEEGGGGLKRHGERGEVVAVAASKHARVSPGRCIANNRERTGEEEINFHRLDMGWNGQLSNETTCPRYTPSLFSRNA